MKKLIKFFLVFIFISALLYFSLTYYTFIEKKQNSFLNKQYIDGYYVGNLKYEQYKEKTIEKFNNLKISIIKNNKENDYIYIKDLNIENNLNEELNSLFNKQKELPFDKYFKKQNFILNYKFKNLNKKDINNSLDIILENLDCFKDFIPVKDASIQMSNYEYIIDKEIYGTEINKELFKDEIINYIMSLEKIDIYKENLFVINLDNENFYKKPLITEQNEELINKKKLFNKYVNKKIIYQFGNDFETVSKEELYNWLSINEQNEISIDYEKVIDYIKNLSKKYNTKGKERIFKTTIGNEIHITKGDYGYSISQTKEANALINDILTLDEINKEPLYLYRGYIRNSINDDIGNTYIEIDLTNQHLWMYKEGNLIIESDIVTGNVSKNHTTPPGIYGLTYKQKNAVLKGQGYASPVSYWMPFNGGIGLHDATWRNKFGGTIYKTNGSHGCINLPKNVAKIIFENIEKNMPIILY